VVLSILAGVDVATLRSRFPHAHAIVRVMPNLPVAIGRGVVMVHAPADTRLREELVELLAPLGLIEWIEDEGAYDAYTALAGCGTGFVLRFIDALASAGVARGIAPDAAARLALATVAGTSAYVEAGDASPSTLAGQVASRGGSTQAGYDVLDRDEALVRLMRETVATSERRNAELGMLARMS
jgi:pyrroline-5-carboxylate reductase